MQRRTAGNVLRWRRLSAATVLPGALVAAVLVAAPFAGTTTAPLAQGASAAATRATGAAAHVVPAAAGTRAPRSRPAPVAAARSGGSRRGVSVHMPRGSLRALLLWYVALALLACAVIGGVAARAARRATR